MNGAVAGSLRWKQPVQNEDEREDEADAALEKCKTHAKKMLAQKFQTASSEIKNKKIGSELLSLICNRR